MANMYFFISEMTQFQFCLYLVVIGQNLDLHYCRAQQYCHLQSYQLLHFRRSIYLILLQQILHFESTDLF